MLKRTLRILGSLACVLLALGCAGLTGGTEPSPTPFPTLPSQVGPTAAVDTPTAWVYRPKIEEQATPTPAPLPTAEPLNAIQVDGELVSVDLSRQVTFPDGARGELLAVHVRPGQQVEAGDLIATLDDGQLQEDVQAAQDALASARAAQAEAEAEAEQAYQLAKENAEWALEGAMHALQVAQMRPPTTTVIIAQASLDKAIDAEAAAGAAYSQALDRPWEPQSVRDGFYRAWQREVADRKLAELGLADAETALRVYYVDLAFLQKGVARARTALERVEKRVSPDYGEAVDEAGRALADAQQKLTLTRLYAPEDGLVVALQAVRGAEVDGRTPIATLLPVDELYFATLSLNERQAGAIRPGQPAAITLRFYPDVPIVGTVERVVPRLGLPADARFAAYLRLLDTGGLALLPGMTGRADVKIDVE